MDAPRRGRASLAPPAPPRGGPAPLLPALPLPGSARARPASRPFALILCRPVRQGAESLGPRLGQPWSVFGLQLRRVL